MFLNKENYSACHYYYTGYNDSIKLPFHKNLALYLIQCYQMSNVGGVKKKNLTEPVSLQTKTDTLSNQQNYQI